MENDGSKNFQSTVVRPYVHQRFDHQSFHQNLDSVLSNQLPAAPGTISDNSVNAHLTDTLSILVHNVPPRRSLIFVSSQDKEIQGLAQRVGFRIVP